jgi:hypothetical protein
MTLGEKSYNIELLMQPNYYDGKPRPMWENLNSLAKWSWERNPTVRR